MDLGFPNLFDHLKIQQFSEIFVQKQELAWESMERRSDIVGFQFFTKYTYTIPLIPLIPLIRTCMPTYNIDKKYNLRSNGGYVPLTTLTPNFTTNFSLIRPVRVLYYEVDVTCLSVRVCLCVCACVCPCQLDEWNVAEHRPLDGWMDGWMGGRMDG